MNDLNNLPSNFDDRNRKLLQLLKSDDEANQLLAYQLCVGLAGNYSDKVVHYLRKDTNLCLEYNIELEWFAQQEDMYLWYDDSKKLSSYLSKLPNLTHLNLNSGYGNIPPVGIGQLTKLKQLMIWRNKFEYLPAEIGQLKNLEELVLHQVEFKKFPPEFAHLTKLQKLILKEKGPDLVRCCRALKHLPTFEHLVFTKKSLESLPVELTELAHLRHLDLSYNKIWSLEEFAPHFAKLDQLETLDLSYNELSGDLIPMEISHLKSLHTLTISKNYAVFNEALLFSRLALIPQLHTLIRTDAAIGTLPGEVGNLSSVHSLELSSNMINHLPDTLPKLSNLEELNLSSNCLTKLPKSLGNCAQLKNLDISSNQLEQLPNTLGNLGSLEKLYLESNHLSNVPASIGNLSNLTELNLYFNRLKSLPPSIGKLNRLQILNISGNQIMAIPAEIGQLQNLRELYISGNPVTTLPIEMAQLKHLKELRFYNENPLLVSTVLWQLTSLEKLILSVTPNDDLRPISKLKNLKELQLSSNVYYHKYQKPQPPIELPEELWQLTNLEKLRITRFGLKEFPEQVEQLTQLKKLDVSYNQLTALPEAIKTLTDLQFLDTMYNQIPEKIEEQIEEWLPLGCVFHPHYTEGDWNAPDDF